MSETTKPVNKSAEEAAAEEEEETAAPETGSAETAETETAEEETAETTDDAAESSEESEETAETAETEEAAEEVAEPAAQQTGILGGIRGAIVDRGKLRAEVGRLQGELKEATVTISQLNARIKTLEATAGEHKELQKQLVTLETEAKSATKQTREALESVGIREEDAPEANAENEEPTAEELLKQMEQEKDPKKARALYEAHREKLLSGE